MPFNSLTFIWIFLPLTLILFSLLDDKYKKPFLLFAGLVFYSVAGMKYVLLLIAIAFLNFMFGVVIDRMRQTKMRKVFFLVSIISNVLILCFFKYFSLVVGLFVQNEESIFALLANMALPIGISFYIFSVLSYLVDIYSGKIGCEKNFLNFLFYVSFFPKVTAGPIVKYVDFSQQNCKNESFAHIAYGIKRFIYGLSKKVIIAGTIGETVDEILALDVNHLSTGMMWFAAILYTLQIYYDFSGYSDMAIGLARMFGIGIKENFDYPYLSKSIKEFWGRWHISLSSWFREYIYFPLGGSRKGLFRTCMNLLIVFIITGMWHGSTTNFIVWGLIHGVFIVIERLYLGKKLNECKLRFLPYLYTMFVVINAWVFFRASSIQQAFEWIKCMFIYRASEAYSIMNFIDLKLVFIVAIAILLCGILQKVFPSFGKHLFLTEKGNGYEFAFQMILLCACIIMLANNTYSPFIYFNF